VTMVATATPLLRTPAALIASSQHAVMTFKTAGSSAMMALRTPKAETAYRTVRLATLGWCCMMTRALPARGESARMIE
jgi:hypothetical protein